MHIVLLVAVGFGFGVVMTLIFGVRVVDDVKSHVSALVNGVEQRLTTAIEEAKAAATKGIAKL